MNNIIYLLALATFFSTLIGGTIILKFRESLPFFFAFSAGSIIAVSFLELLPESIEVANSSGISIKTIMLIIVCSFFFYSLLERFFAHHHLDSHSHNAENHIYDHQHAHIFGPIGAGSLVLHSFLDGAAIGIAFQASFSAGLVIALAVILHDMTDGINTVVLMLKNHQPMAKAVYFLLLDAIAPVLGLALLSFINVPGYILAYLLAFFVGEFLYIGASTLLPETQHHPSKKMILFMALGILLIVVLTMFTG